MTRQRVMSILLWALILLGVLLALRPFFVPTAPVTGAVVFSPPAQYRAWWAEVEQCSGQQGDYDAITWEVAESPTVHLPDGGFAKAFFFGAVSTIVLARPYVTDARIVRHEMLHAVLAPTDGHPALYFRDRCGAFVELDDGAR